MTPQPLQGFAAPKAGPGLGSAAMQDGAVAANGADATLISYPKTSDFAKLLQKISIETTVATPAATPPLPDNWVQAAVLAGLVIGTRTLQTGDVSAGAPAGAITADDADAVKDAFVDPILLATGANLAVPLMMNVAPQRGTSADTVQTPIAGFAPFAAAAAPSIPSDHLPPNDFLPVRDVGADPGTDPSANRPHQQDTPLEIAKNTAPLLRVDRKQKTGLDGTSTDPADTDATSLPIVTQNRANPVAPSPDHVVNEQLQASQTPETAGHDQGRLSPAETVFRARLGGGGPAANSAVADNPPILHAASSAPAKSETAEIIPSAPDSTIKPVQSAVPIAKPGAPPPPENLPPPDNPPPVDPLALQDTAFSPPTLGLAEPSKIPPTPGPAYVPAPAIVPALPPKLGADLVALAKTPVNGPTEILLNPAELGHLRFEIHHSADQVRVVLAVERPETLDLLRRNADQLLGEFRSAGFSGTTLSFGQWDNQGSNPRPAPAPPPALQDWVFDPPPPQKSAHSVLELAASPGLNIRL